MAQTTRIDAESSFWDVITENFVQGISPQKIYGNFAWESKNRKNQITFQR